MTLDEIKKLLSEITPGEWQVLQFGIYSKDDTVAHIWAREDGELGFENEKDAEFITKAPAIVLQLISRIKELKAENEVLEYWAEGYCDEYGIDLGDKIAKAIEGVKSEIQSLRYQE